MRQALLILLALAVGLCLPGLSQFTYLVRPLLMALLFVSFVRIDWRDVRPTVHHLWLLLAQLSIGCGSYVLVRRFNGDLAQALFIIGLAPSAIASVIIIDLMGRDVAFAVSSVLINTFGMAIALPFLMELLALPTANFSLWEVLVGILSTIGIPLSLVVLSTWLYPSIRNLPLRAPWLGITVFLPLVAIGGGRTAAFFLEQPSSGYSQLYLIAGGTALLCLFNFGIGFWVGGRQHNWEGSVSLGRKNSMLAVWMALAFLQPVAIVGPMCYIVWQNLLNTAQIAYLKRGS